ncbi:MAG: DUF2252 domain-containing protein [Hyphomicrobiales bacterium]
MPGRLGSKHGLLAHRSERPEELHKMGRAHRDLVPLESHVEAFPENGRADPLKILAAQDEVRVPELVPIRYGRMSATPFTFLRGGAAVMASDLAAGPRTKLRVEICGDAHLGNFRWYNSPDRRLVFDLNDFDETLPGPFEWDVKRLAASVMVVARNNGFSEKEGRAAARRAVRRYREFMVEASELSPLDLFYYRIESQGLLKWIGKRSKKDRVWKEQVVGKAHRKNSLRALRKLTERVDGRHVIKDDPPLIVRLDEGIGIFEYDEARRFFERYCESLPLDRRVLIDQFSFVDVARKVVGVGSVGTRCLIVLLEAGDGTPLFLQFKQAVPSVLEAHLGPSAYEHSGRRVVEGQRLIQATSDMFLGWARWYEDENTHTDYYVRQLWDGKGKIDVEELGAKRLASFAGMCGATLAFGHARSGNPMLIRGYIGDDETFDDVIEEYAARYADRSDQDHAHLSKAIKAGKIQVIKDV